MNLPNKITIIRICLVPFFVVFLLLTPKVSYFKWIALFLFIIASATDYIDGRIASFCMIENMGEHMLDGRTVKIGGPGCVGTVPEYRKRGIGLMMVKNVTQILKEEGYDFSYIHYTGVASWYQKLGYRTVLKWNKNGMI